MRRPMADRAPLPWLWVDQQLAGAGTYWIERTHSHPHPRTVWGLWSHSGCFLVSASLTVLDAILEEPAVTFHQGCGTGVVIVEGLITPAVAARPALIWACNQK